MGGGRTGFEITVIPSILLQIAFDVFNEIRDFRFGLFTKYRAKFTYFTVSLFKKLLNTVKFYAFPPIMRSVLVKIFLLDI